MNKLLKIGLIILLGLLLFSSTVFGTTGKVYNTNNKGLVLRGSASKSGEPLATVPENKEFEIIGTEGDWYKVNVDGREGYLFAEYVEVHEEEVAVVATPIDVEENAAETSNVTEIGKEKVIHLLPLITSQVLGTVPADTEINIVKTVGKWSYISYENIKGWVRTNIEFVETTESVEPVQEEQKDEETANKQEQTQEQPQEQPQEQTQEQEKPKFVVVNEVSFTKGYVNVDAANVRKEPSTESDIVTTLILNTSFTITGQTDTWYRIAYGDYMGFIYKPLVSDAPTPTSRGNEPRTTIQDNGENPVDYQTEGQEEVTPTPTVTSSSAGDRVAEFAKQYLGYSYVYGGTTPSGGFDCSGFVYYVFNSCGYSISRSLTSQAQTGTAVSKSELQPGDVIFFNNTSNGALGHVGIYIGNGYMVHAANPRRGVVTDTINSGYYNTYYYSARRIAY